MELWGSYELFVVGDCSDAGVSVEGCSVGTVQTTGEPKLEGSVDEVHGMSKVALARCRGGICGTVRDTD